MTDRNSGDTPTNQSPGAGRLTGLVGAAVCAVGLALLPTTQQVVGANDGDYQQPLKRASFDLQVSSDGWLSVEPFLALPSMPATEARRFLAEVDGSWRDGYAPMLMEVSRFSDATRREISPLLRRRLTGEGASSKDDVWKALWSRPYEPHPGYAGFKARLYKQIDPRFGNYFDNQREATIRLDEVRWGGVARDGIPPLKNPKMLAATKASYLADTDVVFGLEINGDARAYPKRVLAWHEMFKDTVGGVSVCGVYCTLCGMMIPYETQFDDVHHELGTSGFLYRSNKLMYDHATESMWSTTKGVPVIGPLVGKGIKLRTRPVVTTTWGEWRRRHPGTTVLSLDTGHRRNYGEGVAYRDYFSTDRLMFTVPSLDTRNQTTRRLANKQEVLALRFGSDDAPAIAIVTDVLQNQPIYQGQHGGVEFVVLTDSTGANRVYESRGRNFELSNAGEGSLRDGSGSLWQMTEDKLIGQNGSSLQRLPAHRAFWFGWRAAHPNTLLVES